MKFTTFLLTFCITLCVAEVEKDKAKAIKREEHAPIKEDHYKDGEHNIEFDHDAIIGSQSEEVEFSQMEPEEAKRRLHGFAIRMDLDSDNYVTKDELVDWILHSFRTLDDEEAHQRLTEVDVDKDNFATWSEYIEKTYGYGLDEIADFKKDKNEEMQEFVKMVEFDKKKFDLADDDKDGKLSDGEFAAFQHPYNFPHMYGLEVERAVADQDTNKNGAIDLKEFINEDHDKESKIFEREQFNNYDKNKDGKLEGDEIKAWVLPDHKEMAEDEADHLIKETDKNKDGKLTYEEIVDQHELWVGSQATDYGRHLHDPEEL